MPTAAASPTVIPFTLRFDHILLDARVNGVPATLVLDTGSGACGLDAEWASALRLAPGPSAQALGVGNASVTLATIDTLQVGDDVELRDERAVLVPFGDVNARYGHRLHGTIGFPFFARYVVEIDYAARELRLHDPATFEYHGPGERIAIDVSKRVPILPVELTGKDGAAMPARLLLDLGTSRYAAVLTKPFTDRHAASLFAGPSVARRLGTGVGGSMDGHVTTLAAMRLGGLQVPGPIVGIPDAGRGFFGVDWVDGTIGAPVLRRTRVILDYPHAQVILEPVEALDAPFVFDASGLSLRAAGPELDHLVIDEVASGSAAECAGLATGDVLRAVDGRPVSPAMMESLIALFTRVGAEHVLRVERDGEPREVRLALHSDGVR